MGENSAVKTKGEGIPLAKIKAALATILALSLVLTMFNASPLASNRSNEVQAVSVTTKALPEGTRTQKSTSTDYIVANFDGIDEGENVIEPVTYERLRKGVLDQVGKSIILLASPNNATSQATLKYINQVARQWGIQKIYFFDTNLGGLRGVDIVPNPSDPQHNQTAPIIAGKGATTKGLWEQLTAPASVAKGSWFSNLDLENYTSDDTYLFVYDKTATATTNPTAITDKLLIDSSNLSSYIASDGATLKTAIAGVFAGVGTIDNTTETNFDDWDFVSKFFTLNPTLASVGITSAADFKIQTVTQPELVNILNTPGTHNVFMSGSWCGDSRAVIAYIAENAKRYNQTVYLYDFRVDGNSSSIGDQAHTLRPETPTTAPVLWENGLQYNNTQKGYGDTGIGFLGNELVELFYPFNSGTANYVQWYHPNGDLTAPLVKASQRNFRSPFLIKYQKDNNNEKGTVVNDWTHEFQDYEKPFAAAQYAQYPISVGFRADYEVSSGPLSNIQKRAGFADLSKFFSGKEVVAHTAPGTISTTISSDNGCGGSDDDPLDNSGDSTLLPYNGTDEYDVLNYDLNVGYYPNGEFLSDGETEAVGDTFEGTATITAKANKGLNSISLDARKFNYGDISVKVGSGANLYKNKSEIHRADLDQQKLNIELSSSIVKGAEFVATIHYTVGTVESTLTAPEGPAGFTKRVDNKGFVAVGEPLGSTYWFPNNNDPADGATYKITLSVPATVGGDNWTTASAGERKTVATSSRKVSTWEVNTPTSPYQVFAAFGVYTELASTVTLASGKEIQGLSFVNSTLYGANTEGARNKADYYYSHLAKYIQDLEAIVGSYPGTSVGFVLDDLSDGHGASAEFGAIETKWRPYYTNKNLNAQESTFVHEFVHQWYGNSVLLGKWSDLWLNEGFATYITDLYYEKAGITQSANMRYTNVYNTTAANNPWWIYPVASVEKETDLWGGAAAPYRKGGLALSVLRTEIGDANFLQILKDWPAQQAGKASFTENLIALAQNIAGSNFDIAKWSATWLYSTSKPAYLTLTGTEVDGPLASELTAAEKVEALKAATANLKIADQAYNGKAQAPKISIVVDGKPLVENVDYKVVYSNNKKVGNAKATITGLGDYSEFAKVITYKILPAKSKSVKAKAAKKSVKVTFAKHSGIDKVVVRYKVKTAKKWTTKTVKASAKSYTISNLRKGKTYQIQVNSYKKVSGEKWYAASWVSKNVKVKK